MFRRSHRWRGLWWMMLVVAGIACAQGEEGDPPVTVVGTGGTVDAGQEGSAGVAGQGATGTGGSSTGGATGTGGTTSTGGSGATGGTGGSGGSVGTGGTGPGGSAGNIGVPCNSVYCPDLECNYDGSIISITLMGCCKLPDVCGGDPMGDGYNCKTIPELDALKFVCQTN